MRTDTKEFNLIPCPFCGEKEPCLVEREDRYSRTDWHVYCPDCGIETSGSTWADEAVKEWNTRTVCVDENFKKNFIDFLREHLNSVYCNTCRANEVDDIEVCSECHRKAMYWSISEYDAEVIADKAIELFNKKE